MSAGVTLTLGAEAAEVMGLYNGTIAALVALLHQDGIIDGRAFVHEPREHQSPVAKMVAVELAAAITDAVDYVEGVTPAPRLRVVPPSA